MFQWDSHHESYILSGFILGYFFFQLPFNYLVFFCENQAILSVTVFIGGALHLSIPFVAFHYDWIGVFIIRILTGIFLSSLTANITNIQANWSTLHDRSRISK